MAEIPENGISYDEDTGEITQFLVIKDNGIPETKVGSPENLLLYDPADDLPFDGGMKSFVSGETAIKLSEDPRVVVAQAGDEYSYILSVNAEVVETTPEAAEDVLRGVYDAIAEDDMKPLRRLHSDIMSEQVRRRLVNVLAQTYDERHRIEITKSGWLIDDFYLVDWNAKMYASNDDPEEGDFFRSGGDVVKKDKTYELVRLRHRLDGDDDIEVVVGGKKYLLTERETLFMSKVKWLLHRRHYHPDEPFWDFADKWATVEDEKPDLDVFDV